MNQENFQTEFGFMQKCCDNVAMSTSFKIGGIRKINFTKGDISKHTEDTTANKESSNSELAAVIVSIRNDSSYDSLFTSIEQKTGPGTHVHTYLALDMNPNDLLELLSTPSDHEETIERTWGKDALSLHQDISIVDPQSVVFNWECCGGCGDHGFANGITPLHLISYLIHQKSYMVMCSDFSLKALIKDWDETILGANPFVQVGTFSSSLTLRFDSSKLKQCEDSAQLQVLGDLCENGKAEIHALSGTIVYAVDSSVTTRDHPESSKSLGWESLEVLTIVSELEGRTPHHYTRKSTYLSTMDGCSGLAGHCILRFPSKGRLLVSCPHWIELSKVDVSVENLLNVTSKMYGVEEAASVQREMAGMCVQAQQAYVQKKSVQYIQQSAPGMYSSSKSKKVPKVQKWFSK